MSEYGCGVGFTEACAYGKERIKEALKCRIWAGEDDDGNFVYEDCTKEEADKEILNIYDNLVFQAFELTAAGNGQDKALRNHGMDVPFGDFMVEYSKELQELMGKYHFENEDEFEEDGDEEQDD